MQKKVLFIFPSNEPAFPLQLSALSAFIKKHGHESRLLPLITERGMEQEHFDELKKTIEEFKPDYAAFSTYETAFPWIKKLCDYIKENWPEIITVAGGYYATLAPMDVISHPHIDVICRGEGEFPLEELLDSDGAKTDIRNLWFKNGDEVIKNPVRPLMEDLDNLPFPDRDFLDYQAHLDLIGVGDGTIKVMATRGCLYNCTYCSNQYLKAIYPNQHKYLRYRSPENVIEELKLLKQKYRFDKVGFHDDNLTLDDEWLKTFLDLYKKEVDIPFYCASRVERCTDEVLDMLKNSGCYLMLFGIESGNEIYRKNMMKRFMSNAMIIDTFKRARKRGILTWSFSMVGLPNETRKMILETMVLNLKCNPDFVMASIFYPLKGTELGDLCYKNGWVNEERKERINSYAWDTILDHPYLSHFEIKAAKYLNAFTAIRSAFFWKIVFGKAKSWFIR